MAVRLRRRTLFRVASAAPVHRVCARREAHTSLPLSSRSPRRLDNAMLPPGTLRQREPRYVQRPRMQAVAYCTRFAALRKWTPRPSPSTPSSRPSASAAQRSKPRKETSRPRARKRSTTPSAPTKRVQEARTDLELCKLDLEAAQLEIDERAHADQAKIEQLEAQLREAQTSATEEERTTYELGWRSSRPSNEWPTN